VVIVIQAIVSIHHDVASFVAITIVFGDQHENVRTCGLHDDAFPGGEQIFFIAHFESEIVDEKFYLTFDVVSKYGYVFDFHNKFTAIIGYWYRKTQYQQVRSVLTG
jgi:hypothetical protein